LDKYPDSNPHEHADAHKYLYTDDYTDPHRHSYGHPATDPNFYGDAHSNGDVYIDFHAYVYRDPD
jgi:hypothetical protein